MLAEDAVGSEKKALLSEEYDFSKLNADFKTESFVLKGLDYSKVLVHYPSSITAGDIAPIQVVVIPSLRFTLNVIGKVPDIDASEETAKTALGKVEYPKTDLLKKLGVSISGEYQKSSFQSGELKLRNNDFSVLAISIKGKGSSFEKISPTKMPLTGLVSSRWLWEMEAKDYGDQKLYIEFESENQDNGKKFYFLQPTTIEVEFSLLQSILTFITKHWQWILGTILIPLVVYAWSKKSKNE